MQINNIFLIFKHRFLSYTEIILNANMFGRESKKIHGNSNVRAPAIAPPWFTYLNNNNNNNNLNIYIFENRKGRNKSRLIFLFFLFFLFSKSTTNPSSIPRIFTDTSYLTSLITSLHYSQLNLPLFAHHNSR